MSLADRLKSGRKPTYEQLVADLDCAEIDNGALRVALRDRERSLGLAMALLDATAMTLHLGHQGQLKTCVRGTCVEMRRSRAQVKP